MYTYLFFFMGLILGATLSALAVGRAQRQRLEELLRENARMESEVAAIAKAEKQMSDHFEALSIKVSQEREQGFLTLAEESFKRLQEGAKAEQEKGVVAVKNMVEPVQKHLENLQRTVTDMEKQRHGAFTELTQNISLIRGDHEKLRAATSTLAQALRSPTARGKWGEIHLQRALEAVGMTECVDFVQQDMLKSDDGMQKPDFVLRLPGNRSIVIDAKVPLDAFLDAAREDATEDERKRAMVRHAEQVKKHIKTLSSRAYWEKLDSPEFVLMYLPGDAYYSAALESDPGLFEAGIESRVFLMTPSTLLPTLRVIEHAWKQEKLAQNAKEISELGQELYKRLLKFGEHLDKMRRGLVSALGSYDEAVGSLERNVMPVARKFQEKQGIGGAMLTAPEQIAQLPRQPKTPETETGPESKRIAQ